eukprot:TRINITY_DN12558_c8_g1_i2.p1 TRINITY_DN12558_c8_g1~~TRINITY_DN12558_c8_g1_i2.p1  ORF type:complete len:430 (+),score=91.50 TRINITY_DN12558_c8_g1_i2:285-1574(+)
MAAQQPPVTHRAAYPQNFPVPAAQANPQMKRRQAGRSGKGLRHFSMCVCNKVQEKGKTTYNEVADELVAEHRRESEEHSHSVEVGEAKNIRRRVYDALNVLMALNIIVKDRKTIQWVGLPSNTAQEYKSYELMKQKKEAQVKKLKDHLRDLVLQHIAFQNLTERNRARLEAAEQAGESLSSSNRIQLPFIVVKTDQNAMIDCQMAEDRSEYFFDFNKPFTIHDDVQVLKQMGLTWGIEQGTITDEEHAKARQMLPKDLIPVLDEMVEHYRAHPAPLLQGHMSASSASVQHFQQQQQQQMQQQQMQHQQLLQQQHHQRLQQEQHLQQQLQQQHHQQPVPAQLPPHSTLAQPPVSVQASSYAPVIASTAELIGPAAVAPANYSSTTQYTSSSIPSSGSNSGPGMASITPAASSVAMTPVPPMPASQATPQV